MSKPTTWRISGDIGDAVFGLALLHALGGKHIIRCVDRPGITAPWTPRVPLIKDLFEAQPYVEAVEISEESVDVDLVPFRRWHSAVTTLVAAQSLEYGMQKEELLRVDGSIPWLTVEPDTSFREKIVIARSPRYNNFRFPWKKIVDHYGPRLVFVGLVEEYASFISNFGHVAYLQTRNLMEVAKAISGSAMFIGNQSSPHAISLGLGHRMISEVDAGQPDCIYARGNVQYVCDGAVELPDIAGSGTLSVSKYVEFPEFYNTSMVPPGMWQYPGLPASSHFDLQRVLVEKKEGCPAKEAEVLLFRHNALREPRFFNASTNDPMMMYELAMKNAFPDAAKQTCVAPSNGL